MSVAWQEFTKSGRLVTRSKSFSSERAMSRFIEKLFVKDGFYQIIAMR